MDPSIDADIQSPENMIVDPDEYVEPSDNEKDDIAIIDPDEPRPTPADDYEAIRELVLPPLDQQPPIIETVHHTWEIKNWQGLQKREHGPIFHAGGYPWRILMFPYGNNSDNVSFYLEHGFEDGPPDDFVCCLQFGLVLWNPNDPTLYTYHTAHHRFTKEEGDWGFTRFVETRKLHAHVWPGSNPPRPLVESGEANMTAYVKIVEDETGVLWHNFNNYDSKKETGFVGLKNQGATCYLNSLIQSLYFTNAFRKAVYQIPTQDEDTTTNSAYTLQRLFYQLQSSSAAVSTNELTKSFGWDTKQIFEQQDVQELSRKLMEVMEKRMKGTEAENVLPKLFCGKVRTYISCINVDYESRRVEDFWDVQLNVSGNKDIEASFRDYIQVETMDGDNQYFAGENYKLQDAKKGVIFESFPEVLHLQLKRFEYDIERDSMMKVNDRYEFPDTFDAAPYLSDDADRSESWIYKLHGVLVHSGDLNAGHYYAFIKPEKDGWFYKYDDDKVTKATMREVLEDNYGGEMPLLNGQVYDASQKPIIRHNSAYMLVYIREARLDEVLLPVTNADTPAHLQRKLEEEAAFKEARRKEREEQHLYLTVRVITQETYAAHGGHDLTVFDRSHDEDPAAAKSYKLLKKCTIRELIKVIGKDTGTDPRRLRVWFMVNRQNKTTRPDTPVLDYDQTIEEAHLKLAGSKTQELRLWAETAETVDSNGDAVWPAHPLVKEGSSPSRSDEIVIFLKWFNVDTQSLVGCGHIYISSQSKVEELAPFILKRMNWPEDTRLKLYEEIKPDMIEPMKAKQSLKAAELQDGDIVCFQRASEGSSGSDGSDTTTMVSNGLNPRQQPLKSSDIIDDARLYYDFLRHRRLITFHCHPTRGNKEFNIDNCESFTLVLSAKHTYDQVAAKVGEKLSVEPTHIRFWTIALNTGNPKKSKHKAMGSSSPLTRRNRAPPSSVSSVYLIFLCFFLYFLNFSNAQSSPVFACDVAANPSLAAYGFCNTVLKIEYRVADLVARLTLQEKIGFLVSKANGVTRLGIPTYEWWSEALHGVSYIGPGTHFSSQVPGATSFPQVILTAASFNVSLFQAIGKVVSTEARAMYNVGLAGLTYWSPNVNIFRDPRWGRGQETPGEDPLLASKYASGYVKGLQETDGGDSNRLKVAACCKHYTAYDVDNWKGVERYSFNAVVTQQDMDDTYQPPFKSCVVDGNVASVMCSYNQVNGKPTCADPDLLSGVIRGEWKLNGYIVSDCDSVDVLYKNQHYTKTPAEAAAISILAGLDLNCGSFLGQHTEEAVKSGLVNEAAIDKAISNNFLTLMRLGFFDGNPKNQIYGGLGPTDVCTSANQELAADAARQGIVLLKNTGCLPLSPKSIKTLAVIGPNANVTKTMIGNYEGTPCKYTTPLQGLAGTVSTTYLPGCSNVACAVADVAGATKLAATADVSVLVIGADQSIEAESRDRVDLHLPGQQQELVIQVAKAAKGPVLLVIMSGGGFDITFAKNDPKIAGILWVGYPGEAGGIAIADIIFGRYNPSGKLPMTWYPQSYVEKVPMTIMNMRPDKASGYPGRTYRFYTGETVYAFGDGLSYTKFSHTLVKAPSLVSLGLEENHVCRSSECQSLDAIGPHCENAVSGGGSAFEVHIKVRNGGDREGIHTVFLFTTPPAIHGSPRKHLVGFEKIRLGKREEAVVRFKVEICKDLSVVDEIGKRKIGLGKHLLHVGDLKHSLSIRI